MNNRYGVDAETRERVMVAARKIGYVPDAAARRLKSHPRLRIEVLFSPYPGINREINPAALTTLQALRERAATRGIALTVRELTDTQAPAEVAADLAAHIAEQTFDVAVTYGHFNDETLAVLRSSGLPVVCLQGIADGARQIGVTVDTAAAAYQATQYLAALGHFRIALVAGPVEALHHRGYHRGFAKAVEEFGLYSPDSWHLSLPPQALNETGAATALGPLLTKPEDERPSAIVFASDWLAMGGLRSATAAGLHVPGDISLIGYDNVPATANLHPILSTFDVHHDMMADSVLDAATELMENPHAPTSSAQAERRVQADLVKRASCRKWR